MLNTTRSASARTWTREPDQIRFTNGVPLLLGNCDLDDHQFPKQTGTSVHCEPVSRPTHETQRLVNRVRVRTPETSCLITHLKASLRCGALSAARGQFSAAVDKRHRLDLTVEARILEHRFELLFTDAERELPANGLKGSRSSLCS